MPRHDVADMIETAFANTPRPGDTFGAISANEPDEGIVNYFRGTTWRGKTREKLGTVTYFQECGSCISAKAGRCGLASLPFAQVRHPCGCDVFRKLGTVTYFQESGSAHIGKGGSMRIGFPPFRAKSAILVVAMFSKNDAANFTAAQRVEIATLLREVERSFM